MKYLKRHVENKLHDYLKIFPAVALTGPRQSGKSTTLRTIFGDKYKYITFDDPLNIEFLESDPRGFMAQCNDRVIFDEVQKVPVLFNYLKMEIDNNRSDYGRYILTGSSQFTLLKSITESLAGRIGLLSLLPFQRSELPDVFVSRHILYGGYPELIARDYASVREWYGSYITNYVERDVRTLHNVGNLREFHRLIILLAGRVSCELNMSELAKEIGVTVKTIQSWLSILEASYIIFFLTPFYSNFGKRIVKRPKVYFYDTGIVCYLTGIQNQDILWKGPSSGQIFENYIVAEIKKNFMHIAANAELFYFRDNLGLECDLIIENKNERILRFVEIKSSQTPRREMVKSLQSLFSNKKMAKFFSLYDVVGLLIYRGLEEGSFSDNINFKNYSAFLKEIGAGIDVR